MVEKSISIPAGSATRFSVAVNYKDGNEERVRWIYVFDPEELATKNLVRKGDRVKITGYFRTRQGVDKATGQPREFRNFILQTPSRRSAAGEPREPGPSTVVRPASPIPSGWVWEWREKGRQRLTAQKKTRGWRE